MTAAPNQAPEDSEATLRRDFELALSDAMKGPAVNPSMLSVVLEHKQVFDSTYYVPPDNRLVISLYRKRE